VNKYWESVTLGYLVNTMTSNRRPYHVTHVMMRTPDVLPGVSPTTVEMDCQVYEVIIFRENFCKNSAFARYILGTYTFMAC